MRKTMKKQSRIFHTLASIFVLTLLLGGPSPATAASTDAGSPKETCLACHGPFDKLISATADYMMLSGEEKIKSNPHRYVPHNAKDISVPRNAKDIPECIYCHKAHPVPLTSKVGLPKADPKWCYGCHHTGVLQCGTCH